MRHPDLADTCLPQSPSRASKSSRVMAYALLITPQIRSLRTEVSIRAERVERLTGSHHDGPDSELISLPERSQ